jgi:formiminotetrahydrofolate cyclodeaminase
MNWQTVLMVYCIWMMVMSVVGLILNISNTKKHFEQGDRLINDQLEQKQKELQARIETIIENIENDLQGRA